MLKFSNAWFTLDSAYRAESGSGQMVLNGGQARLSDLCAAQPSVVVARNKSLELDEPCEAVRLLACLGSDVVGSLEALPGLEAVVVDPPTRGSRLSFDGACTRLRDVIATPEQVRTLGSRDLERLRVLGLSEPQDIAVKGLRWLSVSPRRSAAALVKAHEELEALELELDAAAVGRLSLLGAQPRLARCSLWWAGVRDLSGIDRWPRLAALRLHMVSATTLNPLADSPVEQLVLVAGSRLPDISIVPRLSNLQRLELTAEVHLDDLGDWSHSPLRSVALREMRIGPTGLDGLALAPRLRRLSISRGNESAVERFRSARPDVDVVCWGSGPRTVPAAKIGVVELRRDDETDSWFIFQDLSQTLGSPTNYDVEAALRAHLDEDEEYELTFDSEAGALSAAAQSRSAIERVAKMINELGS